MSHENFSYDNYTPYLRALTKIMATFKAINIPLCLHGGTLLGSVREGDFIQDDDDIDIFYISRGKNKYQVKKEFEELILPALKKARYDVKPISWTFHNGKKEIFGQYHVTKNGITLDVWMAWTDENDKFFLSPYISGQLDKKDIYPLKKGKIKNNKFLIPNKAEKLIELIYGSEWKIPSKFRASLNRYFVKKNMLKIIDEFGWAYYFIAKEQQVYTVHNISYIRLKDYTDSILKDIDIVYFPSPGIQAPIVTKVCKGIRAKYPKIKIIGAYAGENRFIYTDVDIIVSISAKFVPVLRDRYPNKEVIFLPESIDTNYFKPNTKKAKEFTVGYAGRKNPYIKRTPLLEKLDYPVVKKMNHGKDFFVEGSDRTEMINFYNSVSCLVLVSRTECMPRVILEAMACGKAVVCTDVGSIRMLLDLEWVVPVNPDEVVISEVNARLNILNKYPSVLKAVGKRNREYIHKYFSWEKNQHLWDSVVDYLYLEDYKTILEIDDQYCELFKDIEPALVEKDVVSALTIEVTTKVIEPPKVTYLADPITFNSKGIKDPIALSMELNYRGIDFWLLSDSCLSLVNHKELRGNKLHIGVSSKALKDKIKELYAHKNLFIKVEPKRKVKSYGAYKVPVPVVSYLHELFGSEWDSF